MSDKSEHAVIPDAFAALGIRPSLLRALADLKFTVPSEIQTLLIPRALAGVDILGQARTGTGKTAAFALPVLQRVARGLATQALILVPTRELAMQVEAEMQRMGQHTPIRTVAVFGGQKIAAQMKFLKNHPEIIVGTPGRVIDLLDRQVLDFEHIRFVVLDEVDRMLDIGFREDISNILSRAKGIRGRTSKRDGQEGDETGAPQTIFVSATISDEIEKLARRYMNNPEKLIAPGADDRPTVENVEQYYLAAQPWDKYRLLKALLLEENPDIAIVFCRTKRGAEKVARRLYADGIECKEIHGNLAQNKRERVMKNFRSGKFDVLIATDLASRGIDVADISHIINYDIPEDPEVYVHRVGRTARMGARGKAFTLVTNEQGEELTKVENLINMVIPQATLKDYQAAPAPADWTDQPPGRGGGPSTPSRPVQNRFERRWGSSSRDQGRNQSQNQGNGTSHVKGEAAPVVLPSGPPRTIGSKIPINRRHKRRR